MLVEHSKGPQTLENCSNPNETLQSSKEQKKQSPMAGKIITRSSYTRHLTQQFESLPNAHSNNIASE